MVGWISAGAGKLSSWRFAGEELPSKQGSHVPGVNFIWQQARGDGHLAPEGGRGRQKRASRVWKGQEQT